MDYFDELEDRRVREQVAQAGSGNVDGSGETEMCTTWQTQDHVLARLLQRYCLLPTQPSTRSHPGAGATGVSHLCEAAGIDRPPCSGYGGSSSSGTSRGGQSADREDETTPDIRGSGGQLKHAHGTRTEDRQETAHQQHRGSDGPAKTETDGAQTEVAEGPQKDYAVISWSQKRATPFSILGTARRRAFSSWGGKRVPGFHSWGGKRSTSFPVQGKGRSWGGTTDPSLASAEVPAFTILSSKRLPAFSSWGGKRDPPAFSILTSRDGDRFSILDSKTEPAYSILSPERDTPFSILSSNSDPTFNILASHDNPAFSLAGNNYQSTPAFSLLGSKRDSAFNEEGGKRDPAFYSWGGKRDSAFSPWGGKRKATFNPWVGNKDLASSTSGEKTGPIISSLDYKGDAEIRDGEGKLEVTKRGARFSVWDRKKFVDGDGHEKRGVSSWGGKRDMTKSEELEEKHPGNGTVHYNEKQDSRESDDGGIKDASPKSSSAESYQKLLENFDGKMQLGTTNNNEDNIATFESEERKQKHHNTELSGQIAVDGREFDSAEIPIFVTKRSVPPANGKNRVGKAFNSWGGKRSHAPSLLFTILGNMHRPESPRLFSDLLGKRGGYRHVFLGSKKWDPSSAGAVFSSWGGKRSLKLAGQNTVKIPPQGVGRQFRRGADFYSWGGKR